MSNITTLFLVRHGETQWNVANRLQGHKNSALTDKGKHQALLSKHSLKAMNINCAYVSPLLRAKETIAILLEDKELEPVMIEGLKEINLGPWEGKTKQESKSSHPVEYNQFWYQPDEFYLQGAETYQQLQDRVVNSLKDIFAQENNKTILVVSHWISIKVAVAYFSKIPLSHLTNIPDIQNEDFITLVLKDGNICLKSGS